MSIRNTNSDIDVADVDGANPCRSVGEGDVKVAEVDG
jgi:hypothetical protein